MSAAAAQGRRWSRSRSSRLAAGAWAYWTTQGSGSATASVGTLSAPGDVTASASAGQQHRLGELDRLDALERHAGAGLLRHPHEHVDVPDERRLRLERRPR